MQELPGTIVFTRARRRTILHVIDHGGCRSVRVTGPAPPGPLTLLSPFDRIERVPASDVPGHGSRRRAARACAAVARQCHDAGELRAAVDAQIEILPYQLEPALHVARGEAVRVLLADEVGLGKTIQAGLILSELQASGSLVRALVLTPAGLREQWARELRERFALDVRAMDASTLAGLGRALPPWVNPWTLPGVALASIDLLKRGELLTQIETVTWDAVVVDEAHHATRGTDRHAAAALACARARVVVLITATPHSGDAAAFADLCGLGALPDDPMPLRVFRRTRTGARGQPRSRRTRVMTVQPDAAERSLHERLAAYTSRVWREAGPSGAARLAMIVLRKRALSGPASLARSLARRLHALGESSSSPAALQLPLDFGDTLDGELIPDDGEPVAVLRSPGLENAATERHLLATLLEAARAAAPLDAKAAALRRAIERAREPAIVFTEYRDTLDDLRRRLEGRVSLAVMHGGLLPLERQRALAAFTSGSARVLLTTDAAAEGLNLHRRCRWIVHHEAPWSPSRVEQRNGRVDRFGQRQRVHVWHLVAAHTEESDILARLARRAATAGSELAEVAVARTVFEGVPHDDTDTLDSFTAPSAEGSEAEALRVAALKRLPAQRREPGRPVAACVRAGRPFAGVRRGEHLAVFRADVLETCGPRVATLCAAFRGRDPRAARAAAERYFGRAARRAIAVHARARRARADRDRAIERALSRRPASAVQASLFDRRHVVAAEHRNAELARARDELARRSAVELAAPRRHLVSISLVAVFVGR